jgi:hypothetical protein
VEAREAIREKYQVVEPFLSERGRRAWAAAEARALGWGGATLVASATGIARNTVLAGLRELGSATTASKQEQVVWDRRAGAGRKRLTEVDPDLKQSLESLVEPNTRGDPMSPLRWTCLSMEQLSATLAKMGHPASPDTVARLLRESGYSLQANRKTREGSSHPDRDEQFRYISLQTSRFQSRGPPGI